MALPFATLAARTNASVIRRLTDARASVAGGPAFSVGMEDAYQSALDVASSGPACFCDATAVVGLRAGVEIRVDRTAGANEAPGAQAVTYTVSGVEPDGGGLVVVRLRKV